MCRSQPENKKSDGHVNDFFLTLSMQERVRIFKSLQEQEHFHGQLLLQSSVADRFYTLYQMQQFTRLLHPGKNEARKIQIRKWIS
jgi:hypothetical protein